jgi:2-hydroxychromene-2-carboxylate isomerase
MDNVRHWAELCDAPISPKAVEFIKTDTSLALRAALVAKDEGRFPEYHFPAYRHRWAEPRDLSEPEAVHELLGNAGLDADAALERAQSEEIGLRLERDTKDVIERGAFGVPTIFVGDEMFWGNDRFELVRHYLER